ncbi:hypothetical protein [Wenyingzhuangia sp. 2_MG-2023]|uniref:hypothetical protein n=1 Tax=Wenyingzhuangia sp. 2_MG-2023 TaxID=3062639 RepID=UPI0026E3D40B|nr:hypothetical protein [Wenyingzhuangia sp. 2_MG-2023]MDO6737861.1 hypothetical protein [Wenyingzhuangia sp. 2_MG-2023]MDO6802144.1 hypothetical protein [Wenyingzhuangia sp. 1_MG-2023]
MKTIYIIALFMCSIGLVAQENKDQNPNHEKSYQKYLKVSDTYTTKQGTTAQETYVAIDPMEEKRIRKKIRKDNRAMRSLWRHEERMEEAKNTKYRVYRSGYNNYGWNNFGWNTSFGLSFGHRRGFSVFSGLSSPFIGGLYHIR